MAVSSVHPAQERWSKYYLERLILSNARETIHATTESPDASPMKKTLNFQS